MHLMAPKLSTDKLETMAESAIASAVVEVALGGVASTQAGRIPVRLYNAVLKAKVPGRAQALAALHAADEAVTHGAGAGVLVYGIEQAAAFLPEGGPGLLEVAESLADTAGTPSEEDIRIWRTAYALWRGRQDGPSREDSFGGAVHARFVPLRVQETVQAANVGVNKRSSALDTLAALNAVMEEGGDYPIAHTALRDVLRRIAGDAEATTIVASFSAALPGKDAKASAEDRKALFRARADLFLADDWQGDDWQGDDFGESWALPGHWGPAADRGAQEFATDNPDDGMRSGAQGAWFPGGTPRCWPNNANCFKDGMEGVGGEGFGDAFPGVDSAIAPAINAFAQARATASGPSMDPQDAKAAAKEALEAISEAIVALQSANAQLGTVPAGTAEGQRHRHRRLVQQMRRLAEGFFVGSQGPGWETLLPELPGTWSGRVSVLGGVGGMASSIVVKTEAGPIKLSPASVQAAPEAIEAAEAIADAASSIQDWAFTWETRRQAIPQFPGAALQKTLKGQTDIVKSSVFAAKLTKTEAALLREVNRTGSVYVSWVYGRGPEGGRIDSGSRRFKAAKKLIDKGLVQGSVRRHDGESFAEIHRKGSAFGEGAAAAPAGGDAEPSAADVSSMMQGGGGGGGGGVGMSIVIDPAAITDSITSAVQAGKEMENRPDVYLRAISDEYLDYLVHIRQLNAELDQDHAYVMKRWKELKGLLNEGKAYARKLKKQIKAAPKFASGPLKGKYTDPLGVNHAKLELEQVRKYGVGHSNVPRKGWLRNEINRTRIASAKNWNNEYRQRVKERWNDLLNVEGFRPVLDGTPAGLQLLTKAKTGVAIDPANLKVIFTDPDRWPGLKLPATDTKAAMAAAKKGVVPPQYRQAILSQLFAFFNKGFLSGTEGVPVWVLGKPLTGDLASDMPLLFQVFERSYPPEVVARMYAGREAKLRAAGVMAAPAPVQAAPAVLPPPAYPAQPDTPATPAALPPPAYPPPEEGAVVGARLTYRQRKALPPGAFVFPHARGYPIMDRSHAINARARAMQQYKAGRMSKAKMRRVWQATAARYPGLDPRVSWSQ